MRMRMRFGRESGMIVTMLRDLVAVVANEFRATVEDMAEDLAATRKEQEEERARRSWPDNKKETR
jgi:hypothetical protein